MYGSSADIRGCQRGCQAFSKAALAMHTFDLPTDSMSNLGLILLVEPVGTSNLQN